MDEPKNSIEIAIAHQGRNGEVRSYGKIDSNLQALDKVIRKLIAEIGDLKRFENPGELMSYLGLVPSEHSSGEKTRRGPITKYKALVLRGGLTRKHVDLDALMDILEFKEYAAAVARPLPAGSCEMRYEIPAEEFSLARFEIGRDAPCRCEDRASVEILLCVEGGGNIAGMNGQWKTPFRKGAYFLISASVSGYRIEGKALLYKAFVPVDVFS